MAETEERRRPYAALSNVTAVIERARTRNLPDKVDGEFLRIVGIPDVVFGRVMEALRFLGLIEENGQPSDILRGIAGAPDAEYRDLLAAAIREAYREDLARIDPAQDTQARIIDAFRPYEPRSQTSRMVMLFLGLCREAGIPVIDAPRQRQMKAGGGGKSRIAAPAGSSAPRAGAQSSRVQSSTQPLPGLMFGVTETDIAVLSDEEFDSVWSALGLVARARARAKQRPVDEPDDVAHSNGSPEV